MFPRFDNLSEAHFAENSAMLATLGFDNAEFGVQALMRLKQTCESTIRISNHPGVPEWFKTLRRILHESPLPELVLATVDQLVRNAPDESFLVTVFDRAPRALHIVGRIASASPFLTQILLSDSTMLDRLSSSQSVSEVKSREQFVAESQEAFAQSANLREQLLALRRYQKGELLRIGMCDAFGLMDFKRVTLQISLLADAMVQSCLTLVQENAGDSPQLCVIALGKHGGEELNYSSDIDLLIVAHEVTGHAEATARRLIDALSENLTSGFLYRVDLRLRPWGDAGPLVTTPNTYSSYLKNEAELWEKQALLKARIVAGDANIGQRLITAVRPLLGADSSDTVIEHTRRMKQKIERPLARHGKLTKEIKLGAGSIRDIEFIVQSCQLIHAASNSGILTHNTLDAITRLADHGLIDASEYRVLREGYVFLRTLEHALQLMHNQQTHEFPQHRKHQEWLAQRLDYPDAATLFSRFEEHRRSVRSVFDSWFAGPPAHAVETEIAVRNESTPDAVATTAQICPKSLSRQQQQIADFFSEVVAPGHPQVWVEPWIHSNALQVTVASCESHALLPSICCLLMALGHDIRSGDILRQPGTNRYGHRLSRPGFLAVFQIRQQDSTALHRGDQLATTLQRDLAELQGCDWNLTLPRLTERFCAHLNTLDHAEPVITDTHIQIENTPDERFTRIHLDAPDSHGFLFELSLSLGVCGFRIERAVLDCTDNRIADVIDVAEANGDRIDGAARIQELKTAVLLIQQFTNWLPSSADPHSALLRFRDLLHVLQNDQKWPDILTSLNRPDALNVIARVLGISQHLWEDFLQTQHEDLLPLLFNPAELSRRIGSEELQTELALHISKQVSVQEKADVLNAFKDRHLFRIDLRHVLRHCPFEDFSREVTELAEVILREAVSLSWRNCVQRYGLPLTADGTVCRYGLAALGKLGGGEIGFASDIELFLVFEDECQAQSETSVSGVTFFDSVMSEIARIIHARHRGIFEIDLRMRPYGQAGASAISLAAFERYYSPDGDAWPYELQGLVKLRVLSEDPQFADRVLQACHTAIYREGVFDFEAMHAMRERQTRQLVRGGTVNAKLSEGGLVDCEYAVQALQLTFGKDNPALRISNTLKALEVIRELQLLDGELVNQAIVSYRFLRELIDCLRMVRGNALDLTIPEPGTAAHQQLSRRLQQVHGTSESLTKFESTLASIQRFTREVERICLQHGTG